MQEKRPNHRPPKERIITDELNEEFYSINDVAALMKLHHTTVRKMIKTGELKAVKIGRIYRIKKSVLEQFIQSM